jgi:CRP-like cAMP-binding protein
MHAVTGLSSSDFLLTLAQTTIFSGIGLCEQKMIADKCTVVHYKPDEMVLDQGDVGDRLYIIIRGQVQVSVRTLSQGMRNVNKLGPGDVFGEIAILRNIRRTARITTLTPCQFLSINAKDFLSAYQYFPARARDNIQLIVAKRLKERESYMRS